MIRYWLARATNSVRKLAAGLTPRSESVWPGVRNDLFIAHESIYRFVASYSRGMRVVDAGCGTGYGAHHLAIGGASSVIGVDIDPANIRFARRTYRAKNLSFETGDIEELSLPSASADLVVASNSLEHLHEPEKFLAHARRVAPAGTVILAVPPIFTGADLSSHADIAYHRSNLFIQEWFSLLARQNGHMSCFAHRPRGVWHGDFKSPFPSKLTVEDFVFEPSSPEDLVVKGTITAIFILRPEA